MLSMTFLSLALGMSAAQAQTTFSIGPRLGGNLNMATYTGIDQISANSPDYSYSRSSSVGYQVGVMASLNSGHLAFQPSLILSSKGLKQKASSTDDLMGTPLVATAVFTTRVNYLELPLNVVYSVGDDGQGLQLFAGPYLAFGVGGQADYSVNASIGGQSILSENGGKGYEFGDVFVESDPNGTSMAAVTFDARTRRFDAGLNVGVGYRVGPVQAQLGYGLGLLNAQPNYPASSATTTYPDNTTGYNRSVQLSVAYLFLGGGR